MKKKNKGEKKLYLNTTWKPTSSIAATTKNKNSMMYWGVVSQECVRVFLSVCVCVVILAHCI